MTIEHVSLLCLAILAVAFLYSSVGHAGASGYIAVMTLFGLAPAVVKPAALVLNILVATIGAFLFWRAGHFSWKIFWPFAVASVPFAFLGGFFNFSSPAFQNLLGGFLPLSARCLIVL